MSSNEHACGIEDLLNLFSSFLTTADILFANYSAEIATVLLKRRLELGMDVPQFADFIGVKPSKVRRWENGGYDFSLREMVELADKLDIDLKIDFQPSGDGKREIDNEGQQKTMESCKGNL